MCMSKMSISCWWSKAWKSKFLDMCQAWYSNSCLFHDKPYELQVTFPLNFSCQWGIFLLGIYIQWDVGSGSAEMAKVFLQFLCKPTALYMFVLYILCIALTMSVVWNDVLLDSGCGGVRQASHVLIIAESGQGRSVKCVHISIEMFAAYYCVYADFGISSKFSSWSCL